MKRIERFLQELRGAHPDAIAYIKKLPPVPAEYAELSEPLPDLLSAYLEQNGLQLYTHQAQTIELARAGANVMLTTPTASGKTLAFNLAVFERLVTEPRATALYLYPLKALTQDQLRALQELEAQAGIEARAAVYDGDTPQHLRPQIRRRSRIILTNPHALHQYLPWHHKWSSFFKNLRYVVLDEAHVYRGVFGSNVALLLRRLRRIAECYGARPQFILSSATMANPEEHGRRLVGLDFEVIPRSGAPQGEKLLIFWNARAEEALSVHRQTSELLARHVRAGFRTICFTVSRKLAELVARWALEELPGSAITSYRAGYMPQDRREIERRLKAGELQGVASTNALELGIDIGGLDAVIISGYPGTVISTWQMAGRAGRGPEPALVTLIGFENPLDQYFMKHPEAFFDRPHEHAILDLENPYIVLGHAMCAAAELPLRPERDERYFGAKLSSAIGELERQGLVQQTPAGCVYRGMARPVDVVSLEHISERSVQVICDGELLETLELRRAYEEAHPGAVLLHRGETYIIQSVDWEAGIARAAKEDVEYYTDVLRTVDLDVRGTHEERRTPWGTLALGGVRVTENFLGYRVRRYEKSFGVHELDLPSLEFETVALWLTLPEKLAGEIRRRGLDWEGGLHAAEHALIAMTPYHALCDRWDLGGLSTPLHPDTGRATIFLYDGYPGGIGIAEKAHDLFGDLVETTYELVRDCGCEDGCPSCIYSPKCGNQNEPLDKGAALEILRVLLRD
jgi:DEAD/DEAH box helicase domain-containing protein